MGLGDVYKRQVKESPRIIIIIDKNLVWSFNNKEKKPKSAITLESTDTATKPVKPINKTIGIIAKKEIIKLFFKISLFFAA